MYPKRGSISKDIIKIEKLDTNSPQFNEKILEYITNISTLLNNKLSQDEFYKLDQNNKKLLLDLSKQTDNSITDLNDKLTNIKSLLELNKGGDGDNNIANILNVISQSICWSYAWVQICWNQKILASIVIAAIQNHHNM